MQSPSDIGGVLHCSVWSSTGAAAPNYTGGAPSLPELWARAVRLPREGGRPPTEPAPDLGCSDETIRSWLRQADLDEGGAATA
jgi:hypothetical protein